MLIDPKLPKLKAFYLEKKDCIHYSIAYILLHLMHPSTSTAKPVTRAKAAVMMMTMSLILTVVGG